MASCNCGMLMLRRGDEHGVNVAVLQQFPIIHIFLRLIPEFPFHGLDDFLALLLPDITGGGYGDIFLIPTADDIGQKPS